MCLWRKEGMLAQPVQEGITLQAEKTETKTIELVETSIFLPTTKHFFFFFFCNLKPWESMYLTTSNMSRHN